MPNGIPSQDTFARVFAVVDPRAFGRYLQVVTTQLATQREKHLAIDGKYLRHSFDTQAGHGPLVRLNAGANEQRLFVACREALSRLSYV